jgi:hypothetical protein
VKICGGNGNPFCHTDCLLQLFCLQDHKKYARAGGPKAIIRPCMCVCVCVCAHAFVREIGNQTLWCLCYVTFLCSSHFFLGVIYMTHN